MNKKHDWSEIQKYYNLGHSYRDCIKKFNVSRGSFGPAIGRGEFSARTKYEGTTLFHKIKCNIYINTCRVCKKLFISSYHKGNRYRTTCGENQCSLSIGGRFNLGNITQKEKSIKMIESKEYMQLGETAARKWVKRYLIETTGHKCSICKNTRWLNQPIPLICDHIDGKSTNNDINNFRLVCGNCELLLPTHGSKNRGNGRKYEREYKQKKSKYGPEATPVSCNLTT